MLSVALSVATGKAVAAWARANNIPVRTAYEWHRRPEFKRAVARYRRRFLDRALGLLAGQAVKAASEVGRLATKADNEGVRLSAARGLLADLTSVWRFAEMEGRMAEIERHIRDRSDDPAGSGGGTPPGPGQG
jgi:hypothetical protein